MKFMKQELHTDFLKTETSFVVRKKYIYQVFSISRHLDNGNAMESYIVASVI